MDLLSLPPEIVDLICSFTLLSSLKPEQRLHLSSRHCLSCGVARRPFRCPSLLLSCSTLRHIGSAVLYRNATIVIAFDHLCKPRYTLSELENRTATLQYIQKLELLIRKCAILPATTQPLDELESACKPVSAPMTIFSTLASAIPNVKSLGWTVGITTVGITARQLWPSEDEDALGPTSFWTLPSDCHSLVSLLTGEPAWTQKMIAFRLWLSRRLTNEFRQIVRRSSRQSSRSSSKKEQAAIDEGILLQLHSHPSLRPILQLPNLEQLDVFFFISPGNMALDGAQNTGTGTGPGDLLPPGESLLSALEYMKLRRQQEMQALVPLLRRTFSHVKTLRFWRALNENAISNEYEALLNCSD
ncbi:uncharacterized protein Z518_07241 [Rhinocladiella mackenziei CBS 650.93]|uniref:F-box domain-containing protein n=1 Tax=Rhinocladiella mackenziei CBS 650.93 TaxID=1442369 RepID=A0A0D2GZR6_9EURO|nr:uncharacterized protein Z518_07241 [Rhinocladiella mackenziei CBS 650.93]KIX03688.1 hypothetical protein Z518_07241 [Rhinocladiella mackenziei CBS 650.93]